MVVEEGNQVGGWERWVCGNHWKGGLSRKNELGGKGGSVGRESSVGSVGKVGRMGL